VALSRINAVLAAMGRICGPGGDEKLGGEWSFPAIFKEFLGFFLMISLSYLRPAPSNYFTLKPEPHSNNFRAAGRMVMEGR